MNHIFKDNLRRLRAEKKLTQEQAAGRLGVSAQSISRWECGTTMPDITLLPELARLYGVTVDDFFRQRPSAYDNYAQRLTAMFSESRNPDDFAAAVSEFEKIHHSGSATPNDLRMEGILHQYMAMHCILRAVSLFDASIEHTHRLGDKITLWKARRQKAYFLARIGRGNETICEQLAIIETDAANPQEWILLVAAYLYNGDAQAAYDRFLQAVQHFPKEAMLFVFGGDACRELGRTEEAFIHWDQALKLDGTLRDEFSKANYYEELSLYSEAYALWSEIVEDLRRAGYESELAYPLAQAEKCQEKLRVPLNDKQDNCGHSC